MTDQPCIPGTDHLYFGPICVICGADAPRVQSCAECRFSHENGRDDGRLACGARVDDDALAGLPQSALGKMLGTTGVNPIWAVRKYCLDGIRAMLASKGGMPEGFDCTSLSPSDGRDCAAFEWKDEE